MIIRRPYAFLIKNFKKIHLLLFGLFIIIIANSYSMFTLTRGLLNKTQSRYTAYENINYFIILILLIILIVEFGIYILMRYKKKPKVFYLLSIIINILTMILYLVAFNYYNKIQDVLVNVNMLVILRDFFMIIFVFNIIISIIMLIRGLGFNLKKFDFEKDMAELQIKQEDSEEVEVNVKVNYNAMIGYLNRRRKNLWYYIKEYKIIFSIIGIIIMIILIVKIPSLITNNTKSYKLNESFINDGYEMKINNSYVTNLDYNNKVISDDYFVIVSYNIMDLTKTKRKLIDSSFVMQIGRNKYYPNNKYCNYFNDIGGCYDSTNISSSKSYKYILVYSIPKKYASKTKKLYYEYWDSSNTTYRSKVKLENNNVYSKKEVIKLSLGNKMEINNSLLDNQYLQINNYSISDSFDYEYKENDNTTTANVSTIYFDKKIMKLDIETNIKEIATSNLFKYYTKIYYTLKQDNKSQKYLASYAYKNTKNDEYLFLEIDEDIQEAEEIWFEFNVRNDKYKYNLK